MSEWSMGWGVGVGGGRYCSIYTHTHMTKPLSLAENRPILAPVTQTNFSFLAEMDLVQQCWCVPCKSFNAVFVGDERVVDKGWGRGGGGTGLFIQTHMAKPLSLAENRPLLTPVRQRNFSFLHELDLVQQCRCVPCKSST
jgi:hypothetical protein